MIDEASTRRAVRADVVFQVISGETVLLDLNSEEYFGLDAVGTRIWELLQADGLPDEIIEQLHQEYSADRDQLRDDVFTLLNQLEEFGLVVLAD